MADEEVPTGLQLDLLTIVGRLRQIRHEEAGGRGLYGDGLAALLWDRVMTCDLPRLEGHLIPATLAWAERLEESWQR